MELTITWKFKFVLNILLNVPLEAYYSDINKQCCLLGFLKSYNVFNYLKKGQTEHQYQKFMLRVLPVKFQQGRLSCLQRNGH